MWIYTLYNIQCVYPHCITVIQCVYTHCITSIQCVYPHRITAIQCVYLHCIAVIQCVLYMPTAPRIDTLCALSRLEKRSASLTQQDFGVLVESVDCHPSFFLGLKYFNLTFVTHP